MSDMVAELEAARKVAGDEHPEILFNLGSTYAVLNPPRNDRSDPDAQGFSARACRGAGATSKYKDQCETSQSLVAKLGGTHAVAGSAGAAIATRRVSDRGFPKGQGSEGIHGFAGAAKSFRTQSGLAGARRRAREGPRRRDAKRDQGRASPEARPGARDEVPPERQGAEALPGRVQAESRAARGARRGALHLLGPRQDEHGAEAPRAGAEERARRPARSSALLVELGDVLLRSGDSRRRRRPTRARSASRRARAPKRARCLEDVQVDASGWQERVAALLRCGARRDDGRRAEARLFVRAARIARRFAPEAVEGMLGAGVRRRSRRAARPRRSSRTCSSRGSAPTPSSSSSARSWRHRRSRERARSCVPLRRALGHAPPERRARRRASSRRRLPADPDERSGVHVLARDLGQPRKATGSACSSCSTRRSQSQRSNGAETFMLAQAATLTWRQLGNLDARPRLFRDASAPYRPITRACKRSRSRSESRCGRARRAQRRDAVRSHAEARASGGRDQGAATPKLGRSCLAPPPQPAPEPPPRRGASAAPAPVPRQAPAAVPRRRDDAKIAELRDAAEKQEAAKRYNEYVKTLLQLAAMVPEHGREGRPLHEAPPISTSRKFANQAEAVKAYEAILAIDRREPRARSSSCGRCTRSGATGRSSSVCSGARPSASSGADARGAVPRDREARHRARQEARGLHRALARGHRHRSGERRSARRARRVSTSARRIRQASSSVLEKQAEVTYDNGQRRSRSSASSATLYGDRLNNDEGAVTAWRTLLALDPNDRKAQEALKKKYLALGRWDDLEVFYAETGKWDEFIRVLEPQEAKEQDDGGQDRPAHEDRRALGRQEAEARSRRAALREGARARRRAPRAPPKRSSRSTSRRQLKGLAGAIEVKLRHEQDAYAQARALPRGRRPLRGASSRSRTKAFERYLSAFELAPSDEQMRRRSSSAPRRSTGALGRRHRRLPRRRSQGAKTTGDATLAIALRLQARSRARRRGQARRRRARRVPRRLRGRQRERAGARRARAPLPADVALQRSPRIYEKKRELAHRSRRARSRSSTRSRGSTRARSRIRRAPSRRYRAVLEDEPTDAAALEGARRALPRARATGSPTSTCCAGASSSTSTRPSSSISSSASVRRSRSISSDAAGALENYREILFLDAGARRRARGARGAARRTRTCAPRRRASSKSIYEVRGDWQKLVRALEILRRSPRATSAGASRCSARSRASRSRRSATSNARSTRRPRRSRTIPSIAETRVELERLAGEAERVGQARRDLRRDRRGPHRRARSRATTGCGSRTSTSGSARSTRRRKGYIHVLSHRIPADAEALDALDSALPAHRAVDRSHRRLPRVASS